MKTRRQGHHEAAPAQTGLERPRGQTPVLLLLLHPPHPSRLLLLRMRMRMQMLLRMRMQMLLRMWMLLLQPSSETAQHLGPSKA